MTMTDREMLEYAAKAAGYLNWSWVENSIFVETGSSRGAMGYYWNPLTDSKDALELAIQLNILINPDGNSVNVINDDGYSIEYNYADFGSKSEAVRRAIVRAAAEIGKK